MVSGIDAKQSIFETCLDVSIAKFTSVLLQSQFICCLKLKYREEQ